MEYCFQYNLFKQGLMRASEDNLESVVNHWIETHCSEVFWDNLIQVLVELVFTDILQDVRSFLQSESLVAKSVYGKK